MDTSWIGPLIDMLKTGAAFAGAGKGSFKSWANAQTGNALTGAQQQANAFSANEAEKARAFEAGMSDTAFQRQVADMRAAGVNPALLYGAGSSGASTPSGASASTVSPGSVMSMSDMIALANNSLNRKLMAAQADQIQAQADKTRAETDNLGIINKYLPQMQEQTVAKLAADIGLIKNEADLKLSQKSFQDIQNFLAEAKKRYADDYARLERDLAQARTDEANASAAHHLAQKAITDVERLYEQANGYKMASNEWIALAAMIADAIGISNGEGVKGTIETVAQVVKENVDPVGLLSGPTRKVLKGAAVKAKDYAAGKWRSFRKWLKDYQDAD